MSVDPSIFKAYDIRGTFPDQINAEAAGLIGRAFADFLPGKGGVAVGRDMRLDSDELAQAFMKGVQQQGRDVYDIGLVTTDMAYFASGFYDLAGAAMITASHNPGKYNGIKLCGNQALPIAKDSGERKLKEAVLKDRFRSSNRIGTIIQNSIDKDWIRHALSFVNAVSWPNYKVGVDAANGMLGKIFPQVMEQVPLAVTPLFFELDGNFPNHQPNPAITANIADLMSTVNSRKLDLGIAFDGDGDRAFFIDETGTALSGSETGAILAQHMLELYPGSTVLYDARMSRSLPEAIEQFGGKAVRTPVGGGYIRPMARELNAVLACEGAGHYYYRDNYYSDSGLITAFLILETMAKTGQRLSELATPYRKYASSGELSVPVANVAAVFDRVSQAYKDGRQDGLDGLSVDMGDWWFNLRSSHTEPLVRLNLESTDKAQMEIKCDEVLRLIKGE